MDMPSKKFLDKVLDKEITEETMFWFDELSNLEKEQAAYIIYLNESSNIIDAIRNGDDNQPEEAWEYLYRFGFDAWIARKNFGKFLRGGAFRINIPKELKSLEHEIQKDLLKIYKKIFSEDIPLEEKELVFNEFVNAYMDEQIKKLKNKTSNAH